MTRKRQWTAAVVVLAAGLVGLAGAMALAQLSTQAALRQYEQRLAQLDNNNADAVYELAKWCYLNDLRDEAMKLAVQADAKAPDDVRPKFLVYVITHEGELKGETAGTEITTEVATVTDEQVQGVMEHEGVRVIRAFRPVQQILLGLCASRECHAAENPEAPFGLVRQNPTSDKTLVQNFQAINRYCDREQPGESRLLTVPVAGPPAHSTRPIQGTSDRVFRTISTWIDSLKTEGERIDWTGTPPTE
jgi:hypothetical protein